MSIQQLSSPSAVGDELIVNDNMEALGQAFVWSHDVEADTALTVGFNGGVFNGNTVADATLACTDATTNYVVVHRSTRVLSVSTGTTNWDNTTTYGRIARVVFAAGSLSAWHDERYSTGGIFDHGGGTAPVAIPSFFYPGVPGAGALVGVWAAPAGVTTTTFATSIAGSSGKAMTAATAETDFDVRKNATAIGDGTSVGTIRFAAAGTVPTFLGSGFTLTGGSDWITIWAPATPDATLANVSASLYATRSN